jgi:hypothetical protein
MAASIAGLKRKAPDGGYQTSASASAPAAAAAEAVGDSEGPFSVHVNLKHAACAVWWEELQLVEVTKMRGNFWNRHGFTRNAKNYLYPEEALMLVERGHISIEGSGGKVMPSSVFYEKVISIISLPVYLAFLKLRVSVFLSF